MRRPPSELPTRPGPLDSDVADLVQAAERDERGEQHDARQVQHDGRVRLGPVVVAAEGMERAQQGLPEAEREAVHDRFRHTDQARDDGDRERLDAVEDDLGGLEGSLRDDEPGQCGEGAADGPRDLRHAVRVDRGEFGQFTPVDHRADGHAEERPLEQQIQQTSHDEGGDQESDLFGVEGQRGDVEGAQTEQARNRLGVGALHTRAPLRVDERQQSHGDSERGNELFRTRRLAVLERAENDTLEQEPEAGTAHHQHDRHDQDQRQAEHTAQLPAEVAGEERDREVRNVEHTGGLVRDDDARRRKREVAAEDQAEQRDLDVEYRRSTPARRRARTSGTGACPACGRRRE